MSLDLQVTRMFGFWLAAGAFLMLTVQPHAQTAVPASSSNAPANNKTEVNRSSFVEIPAVNYALGDRKIEFTPTALMPGALGQGQVKASKDGGVSVEVQFSGLASPAKFGNEFLTYVLWGSIPNGRTLKLGELTLKGNQARSVAKTVLRTFAMMVTAEPYAAVAHPSSIVVLKASSAGNTTQATLAQIELQGDIYAPPGYKYEPLDTSSGYPSDVLQAMNARRIAQVAGAEKYAFEKFQAAESLYQLMIAEAIQEKKISKRTLGVAKAAAQGFEDARELAVRNQR